MGWVGFDPTNAIFAGTDHIFTAMGRDYADVAPIDGVFLGGGSQNMTVAVDVFRSIEQGGRGADRRR
jgi:transglutaminase-like putative cysteine protease